MFFSAVIALAAMIFASYMSGQKKVIEKYYTAIVRRDEIGAGSCYSENLNIDSTILQELRETFFGRDAGFLEKDGNIVHVRIDYIDREMSDMSHCLYDYTVTYYNDDSDSFTTPSMQAGLVRKGLSWRIAYPAEHQFKEIYK